MSHYILPPFFLLQAIRAGTCGEMSHYILPPFFVLQIATLSPNQDHQYWTRWINNGNMLDGNMIHEIQ
jgi:hypothetical protein